MAFSARTFIFDSIPSEVFNVYLGTINDSGETTTDASNGISILTQKIYRRPSPLMYGVEQNTVLNVSLSMYMPDGGLDEQSFANVSSWLFGAQEYKILRLCQNDMLDVYLRCFLTDPKVTRIGNFVRGMTCTAVADSPWFWKTPKSYHYSWGDTQTISDTINFFNESENNYYTYPSSLILTANSAGGTISIINTADNDREFLLSISSGEIVTMDCYNQIISSSVANLPLENFNLNFLRFKKGLNVLNIMGGILSMDLTVERAVKIGG